MEFLELDDINFYPCTCGYQICRFCWNKLRTEGNGLCPACRQGYSENPADFKPLTSEEMAKIKAEKTPFPIFFHAAWFRNRPHRVDGFLKFIDSILALPDVYFITSQELIQWTRFPEPLESVHTSQTFHCDFADRPAPCGRRKSKCSLKFRSDKRQWSSCQRTCPKVYPWVNNLEGESKA